MFKKTKIFIASVFLAAFCLFLAAPVFGYDTFEITPEIVCRDANGNNVYFLNTFGAYNVSNVNYIGSDLASPLSYHADGDHVSLFCHFEFSSENISSLNMFILPNTYSDSVGDRIGTNIYSGVVTSSTPQLSNIDGSFQYQGTSCTFNGLVSRIPDPYSNSVYYSFSVVFDLNLVQEIELHPLRIGFGGASFSLDRFSVRSYILDSSIEQNLIDIYFAIEDGFENLELDIDLSGIESGIADIISNQINIYNSILESVVDDGETDPDITAALARASEFQSEIAEYNDLQEALIGTLEEYTFPNVSDANIANLIITPIFENEIVLFLVAGVLALLIACAILL